MTIVTHGQTVGLDSTDNQSNVQVSIFVLILYICMYIVFYEIGFFFFFAYIKNVSQQNTQIHNVLSNINILQPQTIESHQMSEQTVNETTTDDNDDMEGKEHEIHNEGLKEDQEELVFPIIKLVNLEEKIHSQRWIVPVLPDQELVSLLNVTIAFCKKGLDVDNEGCQKFFRDAMVLSFTRILTDDAVNSWKVNIQQCIMNNCMKLVELIVLKLDDDNFPFVEMLGMLFNPLNK